MVPPQVCEEDFDINTARAGRYPAFPPYGAGLLSRSLSDAGYITEILDLNFEVLRLLQLRGTAFKFDEWQEKLLRRLATFAPDAIGISCMFSMTNKSLSRTAEFVKVHSPSIPIIAGGVHVSGATQAVLRHCRAIDFAIRYEADNCLPRLIDYVNGKASRESLTQIATLSPDGSYCYLEHRDIPGGQSLNISPDYGNLPIGEYSGYGKIGAYHWLRSPDTRASSILSVRGCRGQCTFCSVRGFNGTGVRTRDVVAVVDEMQRLHEYYGIEHLMFLDDDLFYQGARALRLFNEMTRRNLALTWDASNGVIASSLTEEIADAAARSGCVGLTLGIESGNPDILRRIKKPSTVEHFHRAAEILRRHPNIYTKGFLMVGFDGETVGQINETVNLALAISLDWYPIQVLSVLPGTALAEKALNRGEVDEHQIVDVRFFVGAAGAQRKREEAEHTITRPFENLLRTADGNYVPTPVEIQDIWLTMDFLVNYHRIIPETNLLKLRMKRLMLMDIVSRMSLKNPMSILYLGVVERKLCLHEEARVHLQQAVAFLEDSAFWQTRFADLGQTKLLDEMLLADEGAA